MHRIRDVTVYETPDEIVTALKCYGFQTVRKKGRGAVTYVDGTCTFDIETTSAEKDGFAYTFQGTFWGHTFLFRYIEDFINLIEQLIELLNLNEKKRFVIYVHNLGFEHVYITQILASRWGAPKSLFVKSRKALTITYTDVGIEFRDSLRLFQKSLASCTKGLPHEKLVGDLDYGVYRTPDMPLTEQEEAYCVWDVVGLYEAIERMKHERGYNTATIPLTNTSVVLGEVDKHLHDGKTMKRMNDLILTKEQLTLAYNAMAGGDTHGTRWRAGTIYKDCNSYDLKSAHPSQQVLWRFPSGQPIDLPPDTPEDRLERLICNGYGWIAELYIENIQLKPECPNPTISVSKCRDILYKRGTDNGRLMGADAVFVYADSNDYLRLKQSYTYDRLQAVTSFCFYLEYLPDTFRGAVLDFFRVKETAPPGAERNFAKICVNTIFGACAQKRCREEHSLIITDDGMTYANKKWQDVIEDKDDEKIAKLQKNRLPFLWGLWTSSLTRLTLYELQKAVGWENLIYWDTDSVKYQGEKKMEVDVLNERIKKQCINRKAVVQKPGQAVYIGIAEDEHPDDQYGYKEFVFLHAKCYADRLASGEAEITISGVQKDKGKKSMKNDLANMHDGFFIADAGGIALTYWDKPIQARTCWSRPTQTASFVTTKQREYMISDAPSDKVVERLDEIIV